MNRMCVAKEFGQYLREHHIEYVETIDNGTLQYAMIFRGYSNAPDQVIETCVWFYSNAMEVRVYYSKAAADWCKNHEDNISDLLRLLNFINATVWLECSDGMNGVLYQSGMLYTSRLYLTEDDCYDITFTTMIPYDFYEVAPLETKDYITVFCPELLNALSPAIFFVLLGEMSLESAKDYLKEMVM